MNCACSCGLLKSVVAVGGLVIAGLGGYNAITTGCVFGTCSAEAKLESSLTPVAGTSNLGGCCGGSSDETAAKADCEAACETGAEKAAENAKDAEAPKTADEATPAAPETLAGLGG